MTAFRAVLVGIAFFSLAFDTSAFANSVPCHKLLEITRLYSIDAQITNEPINNPKEKDSLKLATFNTLQLRMVPGESTLDLGIKSEGQIQSIAETVSKIDPDILFLQEIEGQDTVSQISQQYWKDAFQDFRTTHARGLEIQNIIAVKKNLFAHYSFEHVDFKRETWQDPNGEQSLSPVFQREPLVVTMTKKAVGPRGPPDYVFVNWHLKSQKDRNGDPGSRLYRIKQAETLLKFHKALMEMFPGAVIVHGGDFNGNLGDDPALSVLHKDLSDVSGLFDSGKKDSDNYTNIYHPKGSNQIAYSRVDGFFISRQHQGLALAAEPVPLVDESGNFASKPLRPSDLNNLASDHRPQAILIKLRWDMP